jgi:hypothetical protein
MADKLVPQRTTAASAGGKKFRRKG